MTVYDAAMVGLVVAGMVWGAWRGIVWQAASIASLVLGYLVSHTTSDDLAFHFPGDPVVARGLAMLAIYVAVSGGVFFGAWLIRATLRKFQFEAFDRYLGMLLGGVEGALIGIVGTLFVVSLSPESRKPIFESPSGRIVGALMAQLGPILPSEARQVLAPFWDAEPTAAVADADAVPAKSEKAAKADPVDELDVVDAPRGEARTSEANDRSRTSRRR